jgi:CBS domain-containing protein
MEDLNTCADEKFQPLRRALLDQPLKSLDMCGGKSALVTLKYDSTVHDALTCLAENKILAAPVFDDDKKFHGVCDMMMVRLPGEWLLRCVFIFCFFRARTKLHIKHPLTNITKHHAIGVQLVRYIARLSQGETDPSLPAYVESSDACKNTTLRDLTHGYKTSGRRILGEYVFHLSRAASCF